jgi:hypothetical protein
VARVFGSEKGVYIGSIKPNIGHGEGASGLSSLIKAILALEHRIIPPNAHFNCGNPKIPFQAANLRVPIKSTQWPADQLERISINSFGIGVSYLFIITSYANLKRVQMLMSFSSLLPHMGSSCHQRLLLETSPSYYSFQQVTRNR